MSPLGCQKMSAKPCNRNAEESFPVLSLKSREQKPPNPLLIQDKNALQPSAQRMAHQGVPPGASRSLADAALVPEDQRGARGAPLCSTRFPATESAGERVRG